MEVTQSTRSGHAGVHCNALSLREYKLRSPLKLDLSVRARQYNSQGIYINSMTVLPQHDSTMLCDN